MADTERGSGGLTPQRFFYDCEIENCYDQRPFSTTLTLHPLSGIPGSAPCRPTSLFSRSTLVHGLCGFLSLLFFVWREGVVMPFVTGKLNVKTIGGKDMYLHLCREIESFQLASSLPGPRPPPPYMLEHIDLLGAWSSVSHR